MAKMGCGAVVVALVATSMSTVASANDAASTTTGLAQGVAETALEVGAADWFGAPQAAAPAGERITFGTGGLEPLVPERILDTRAGNGAPAVRVGPDGQVDLQVAGRGGVPSTGAGAVVLNVTGVAATQASFVTVWPTGAQRPAASNLNVAPGDTVPNLVVAKLGAGGRVSLFNRFGEIDLVVDVAGWFPEGAGLEPLVPDRILDTRVGNGAPAARVGPDGQIDVQVTGRGGVPAAGVGAVVMNVTAAAPTAASFVTVWPAGGNRPTVSNLNLAPGGTVANLVVVKLGEQGRVSMFNRFGDVDLVADVAGWFPADGGFVPLVPDRILDTRDGNGAPAARVGPDGQIDLAVTGRGGVPADGVGAVVMNVTAVAPSTASFVTAWPAGVTRPTASNLNLTAGHTVPNLVIVKVGKNGHVSLFNRFGDVDLIADIAGWFPATADTITVQPRTTTTLIGPGDVAEITNDGVRLTPSADVPVVGGHLAVFPHAAVPDGASGRVIAVAPGPEGTTSVTLEPANLQDLFADLDVSGTFGTVLSAAADRTLPFAHTERPNDGAGMECSGTVSASTMPTVEVGGIGGSFDFDLSDRYTRLVLDVEPKVTWVLSASTSYSCDVTLGKRKLGVLGPLVFGTDLGFSFGVTVTAHSSAALSVRFPVRVGFVYDRGDVTNLSNSDIVAEANSPGGADISAHFGLFAEPSAAAFGIAGFSTRIAPNVTASIDTAGCINVDGSIDVTVTSKVGKWGVGWEFDLVAISFGPLNLYRRGCGGKAWTGLIEVTIHRDNDHGASEPREVSDETALYVLQPSEDAGIEPDGSGRYPARITANGTGTGYSPTWTGSEWSHCTSHDYFWAMSGVTRPQALQLEYDDSAGGWRYSPLLVPTSSNPAQGAIGGATGTWTSFSCSEPGPPQVSPIETLALFVLGWEGGTSLGTALLNDTNPAADRLVGSTTWTRANPPTPGTLFDNTTTWSYTMTYDLTLVELG